MALRVAAEAMTTVSAVMESNCPCVADLSNDEVEVLIDAASDALAIGTGNVVEGRRTITVLPIADYGCDPDPTVDGIPLGGHDPRVVSVTINGTVLDPSSYRFAVMQGGLPLLVRVATDAPPPPWPRSQALWRQGVGPNTFAITYTYGVHVDWMVSEAAIELVCDFAVDNVERKKTAVRPGVSTLSMAGATAVIDRMLERLRAGEVGPATTRLVSYYAPFGRAVVNAWSPEMFGGWRLVRMEQAS